MASFCSEEHRLYSKLRQQPESTDLCSDEENDSEDALLRIKETPLSPNIVESGETMQRGLVSANDEDQKRRNEITCQKYINSLSSGHPNLEYINCSNRSISLSEKSKEDSLISLRISSDDEDRARPKAALQQTASTADARDAKSTRRSDYFSMSAKSSFDDNTSPVSNVFSPAVDEVDFQAGPSTSNSNTLKHDINQLSPGTNREDGVSQKDFFHGYTAPPVTFIENSRQRPRLRSKSVPDIHATTSEHVQPSLYLDNNYNYGVNPHSPRYLVIPNELYSVGNSNLPGVPVSTVLFNPSDSGAYNIPYYGTTLVTKKNSNKPLHKNYYVIHRPNRPDMNPDNLLKISNPNAPKPLLMQSEQRVPQVTGNLNLSEFSYLTQPKYDSLLRYRTEAGVASNLSTMQTVEQSVDYQKSTIIQNVPSSNHTKDITRSESSWTEKSIQTTTAFNTRQQSSPMLLPYSIKKPEGLLSSSQAIAAVAAPTVVKSLATPTTITSPKISQPKLAQLRTPAADDASSAAAETTSQMSSVSSSISLIENIDKHTSSSKNKKLDFDVLKSAMKQSCNEGKVDGGYHGPGNPRRMSLFNTVMRRVSIHRKESTPTGRIATFFFGADDAKDGDVANDDQDSNKDPTGCELLKTQRARRAALLRESLFRILSGLYGIVIVILGAVIPITEIFIPEDIDSTFEGFYVYLYVASIMFLIYVYAYLLRRNRLKTELLTRTLTRSLSWNKHWARSWARADTETRSKLRKRMISLDVSNHHTGTFYLRVGVLGFGIGSMIHSGLNFGSHVSVAGGDCSKLVQSVKPLIHLVFTFFQLYFIFMNSKMCIHRYKKLARFGLVHMCATNICVWFRAIVVETLHVINHSDVNGHGHGKGEGHLIEHPGSHHSVVSNGHHRDEAHEESDVGHLFGSDKSHNGVGYHGDGGSVTDQHSGVLINASGIFNIGRRLHAVVTTSTNDYTTDVTPGANLSTTEDPCQWTNMMSKAVEAAGPYLYPCTIEYSLMCAGILYIMWTNVGRRPRRPRRSEVESDSEHCDDEEERRAQRMSVDCTSSSRGLFLGILLMVVTIISIIAFYMLVNQEELKTTAIILTHLSGTFMYTVTLLALIFAASRMKNLSFHIDHDAGLEDILILISYTGLLAFIIFSLIASILAEQSIMSSLTILSNVAMLVQATVQTIFMLAGDRMSAATEHQVRKKPGREFITFLLISNFAMWAINTFETQKPHHNPIQVEFYGPEAWAIFTHISVPLGIYYRFHSTVCLSNIWKNAWKKRKHM